MEIFSPDTNDTYYILSNNVYSYGEVQTFATEALNVTVEVDNIDKNVVTFKGNIQLTEPEVIEFGVMYYPKSTTSQSASKQQVTQISANGDFTVEISGLLYATEYYWRYYLSQNEVTATGPMQSFTIADVYNIQSELNVCSAIDLSSSASANCYIISEPGLYKFKTVKGNSDASVGSVASASILWETFGTSMTPSLLDLIDGVCCRDGYIVFQTADAFKEGNAVIAAKDAKGNILWSWHIWFTDQPQGQVYFNDAGTMMDRNLGATSATPGDVGALGLLYQWGRKDPFLGSSSISSDIEAKSTITWPSAVESNSSTGTIEFATAHPKTFITSYGDWYRTGLSSTDNIRWTTSESSKSIYDPCPVGWRVPDGGDEGVWSKALGSSSMFNDVSDNYRFCCVNFSGKFGSASTICYPVSGFLGYDNRRLFYVGVVGYYWSASLRPQGKSAYALSFNDSAWPSYYDYCANGYSVRCLQE